MTAERVDRVEAWVVEVPRDVPYLGPLGAGDAAGPGGYFVRGRTGTVYHAADRTVLVRVMAASGAEGWGETYGLAAPRATAEILGDLLAPFVMGRDPRDPAALHDQLRGLQRVRGAAGGAFGDALAALDIALWDLAAKLAGLPLARMLGGQRTSRIPAYVSGLPEPTLSGRVALAESWAARGFTRLKFAAAVSEQGVEAEMAALRGALGPGAEIAADLHWRHSGAEAAALAWRLLPHRPWFLEAPVAPEDLAGLRQACAGPVPVAAGEEWSSAYDAALRLSGPAILQPEMAHTGVTEFQRIGHLAAAHHLAVLPHATIGVGVFLAASLHAAAALPGVTGHEYQPSILDRNQHLLESGPALDGDSYAVPAGPGHGARPGPALWRHAQAALGTMTGGTPCRA